MSFIDRLISWWRRPGAVRMYRDACLEDPDGAIAELQEEQVRVAEELEATFLAFDQKLQQIARRLSDGDAVPSGAELARLRHEQLALWRLVRRSQAASRSTAELERELREWAERTDIAAPQGHPDHPRVRAEIIGSELRSRGNGLGIVSEAVAPMVVASHRDVRLEPAPEWRAAINLTNVQRELATRQRELTRLLAAVKTDPSVSAEIELMRDEIEELKRHVSV